MGAIIVSLISIWGEFSNCILEVDQYRKITDSSTEEELKKIKQAEEYHNKQSDDNDNPDSFYNMVFQDAVSGKKIHFGYREINFSEMHSRAIYRKNRIYQWLLVEAYEAFEDYLKKLYAYCGAMDSSFLSVKESNKITLIENRDRTYKECSALIKKKDEQRKILNKFRNRYPGIEKIERNNRLDVDLKYTIFLIEEMRHVIVHDRGVVENRDEFIKKIAKDCGVINNNNIPIKYLYYVNSFFENDYGNTIVLLEKNVPTELPIKRVHNRLSSMVERLTSYAYMLFEQVFAVTNQ